MSPSPAAQPRFITLVLLCGLSVVSLNLFLPSLPNIAAAFDAPYGVVTLSIAGYAAMTAVLQLIMGPLSDRFGRRPVILSGLVLFCLASMGCLLAGDIVTFLVFRMMQAAIIAGYTVTIAAIRDISGAQEAAGLMGYMGMVYAIAPLLGPLFGGVLDGLFGWRAGFWAFLAFGLAVFVLCWFDFAETNKNPSKALLDQFRSYPELLASRRFWGYSLCMGFSIGGFYAFLGGAPLVAWAFFGISAAELGVYLGSTTIGFVLGSFIAGKIAARHDLTTMMIAGRLVAGFGLLAGLIFLICGVVHPVTLFGACIFYGIGNGITLPSSISGAMSVRPQLAGSASGLSGALTVAGGALMSGITGAVLTEENGAVGLLGMMLLSALLGLAAALYVVRVNKREGG